MWIVPPSWGPDAGNVSAKKIFYALLDVSLEMPTHVCTRVTRGIFAELFNSAYPTHVSGLPLVYTAVVTRFLASIGKHISVVDIG